MIESQSPEVPRQELWLVGAGPMAVEYARVLSALAQPFSVIGRSESSARSFEQAVGLTAMTGGLKPALANCAAPASAIVAVNVEHLASTANALIRAGTKRILLEKPGALNLDDLILLRNTAKNAGAEVLIAYNRRYYTAVYQARAFIERDGGIKSAQFEFTEWSHKIGPLVKSPRVKERWLLANSSHVIDLVFHLCGRPVDWSTWHAGTSDWHPTASRFVGAGITEHGVIFSYLSDWQAPGRWSVELLTSKHRLILRPLEQLQVMNLGQVTIEQIRPTDIFDQTFKPGLYRQTKAFLEQDDTQVCSIEDQVKNVALYNRLAGYSR